MERVKTEKIERLKSNLSVLRKVAGWSGDDLADVLGVSRQTILNLETNPSYTMTRIQYLAIRSLLDHAAAEPGNEMLAKLLELLVDRDDVPEDAKKQIRDTTKKAVSRAGPRTGSAAGAERAIRELIPVLAGMATVVPGVALPAAAVLREAFSRRDTKIQRRRKRGNE